MPMFDPPLYSAPCLFKYPKPLLTKDDIPYPASLVFNAAVNKYNGKYVMIFRDDYGTTKEEFEKGRGFTGTAIGVAESDNGIDGWRVRPLPLINSEFAKAGEILRYYDPRLTILEGKPYLCMAVDTRHGLLGCVARVSETFDSWEILSTTVPDNRNMALFPEKIGGMYVRLERPMPIYSRGRDRFDLWLSRSPDLRFWGDSSLVLAVENVPYANDKIGPAAPPVKTEKGWLTTFHAVDIDPARGKNGWDPKWHKRYCAGIALLDLEDPSKIVGMCKTPLIAPELPHEVDTGYRTNAIFPCGMVLEDNGEVKIYYGAADTVVCLATAGVDDLLRLCTEPR